MSGQQAIIFIPFALHIYRVYIVGRGLDPSAPSLPCQREVAPQRRRDSYPACRPYFFKLPIGAGHARPARFRKLLC